MEILFAVLSLGILGFLFGVGLSVASKKFSVKKDNRLEKIQEALPGANCGACGTTGCSNLAEELVSGKATLDHCPVADEEARFKISQILGVKLEKKKRKVAVLHCAGGIKAKDKFIYDGIKDCVSANLILGGQKSCSFGCLGFGSCVMACPFGAIKMGEDGLPLVDKEKCKSCGRCVKVCPKKLFSLVEVDKRVVVACSSHDIGKDVRQVCSVGCIACGLCVKACKFDAIHLIDNLAVIDYNKCTLCGECAKVCPTKAIKIL